ncbi:MAG: biopolymer transporter ExbD [Deltaproteobacteria bacterium]|nr:biopolymer transporter ExbD [Deltaproteobacteria bacterium]
MAIHLEEGDEPIAAINVTPLVDIMLVLLIIFMVTATYVARREIAVDLPRAAAGGEALPPTVAFAVDAGGLLFVDGAPASPEEARRAVRQAVARSPEARALISADRATSHGRVVEVIDLVKGEGMVRFAIDVVLPEGAGQGG